MTQYTHESPRSLRLVDGVISPLVTLRFEPLDEAFSTFFALFTSKTALIEGLVDEYIVP
jgi:hypothetical protein